MEAIALVLGTTALCIACGSLIWVLRELARHYETGLAQEELELARVKSLYYPSPLAEQEAMDQEDQR